MTGMSHTVHPYLYAVILLHHNLIYFIFLLICYLHYWLDANCICTCTFVNDDKVEPNPTLPSNSTPI